jgi:hypothetical protein
MGRFRDRAGARNQTPSFFFSSWLAGPAVQGKAQLTATG